MPITDQEALDALRYMPNGRHHTRTGIGTCRGASRKMASAWTEDDIVVINLSGRGDKDVESIMAYTGGKSE